MNMMGAAGGAVAPLSIGIILDNTARNWAATFWSSGAIYFLGGLCWLWIDPVRRLGSGEMTDALEPWIWRAALRPAAVHSTARRSGALRQPASALLEPALIPRHRHRRLAAMESRRRSLAAP
jgi:hypothetical protein